MLPLSVPRLFGLHAYCVLTDSMAPLYEAGDLIFVQECTVESVGTGDVISYIDVSDASIVTTHRVVNITESYFITKGDANNTEDPEPVVKERLLGMPLFFVPSVGHAAMFLVSIKGYVVSACVLLTAIMLWIIGDILCPKEVIKASGKASGKALRNVGIVMVGAGIIYLGFSAWEYISAREDGEALLATVSEAYAGESTENADKSVTDEVQKEQTETIEVVNVMVEAVASLHNDNPNIKAWIRIDDTPVDYPVMQGEDDAYYLRHNYLNEYSKFGSIFMRATNSPDFSDNLTVIYGHNFKTDIMFGSLIQYEDEAYRKEHPYITVFTPHEEITYEITDCYNALPTDAVYAPAQDAGDKYLVLSTCNRNGSVRFLIVGKRLEDIDKKVK